MGEVKYRRKGTLIESKIDIDILIKKQRRNEIICLFLKTFLGFSVLVFFDKMIFSMTTQTAVLFLIPFSISLFSFVRTFDLDDYNLRISKLLSMIKEDSYMIKYPSVIFFSKDYKKIEIRTVETVEKQNKEIDDAKNKK